MLLDKCQKGCQIRIAIGDPDSEFVRQRDDEEQDPITLVARIRSSLRAFEPLLSCSVADIRYQYAPLDNSVFRFDDDMFVATHLHATPGSRAPLLHLRRLGPGGMFSRYAAHFESIWASTKPLDASGQPTRSAPASDPMRQHRFMGRQDCYNDPNAPAANSLVPAASAIVVDDQGRIVLQRRRDNDKWALPGGVMELGESIADCARREVLEETGLSVTIDGIVGLYSDPKHVFAYDDGRGAPGVSICFRATVTSGTMAASSESHEVTAFTPDEIDHLAMSTRYGSGSLTTWSAASLPFDNFSR